MPFSDTTPLLEFEPGEKWDVAQSFTYSLPRGVGNLPAGLTITIPVGMETDLASIPRPLWPILPPNGDYAPAAIVHDRLYRVHQVVDRPVTRKEADAILLMGMEELGVKWLTRWTIYAAVRLGGGKYWR